MSAFILFRNNTDVGVNKTIATKMGEAEGYKAAMQLFKDRKLLIHHYIIIRKDTTSVHDPRLYTNLFGECSQLGGAPWIFDLTP